MGDTDSSGSLWVHPAALVTDTLLALCFVAPLAVGYWRGTWFLLDSFLYPPDEATSCWISLAIGFSILLLATLFQRHLQTWTTRQSPCLYFVISRLYIVVFCLGSLYSVGRGIYY